MKKDLKIRTKQFAINCIKIVDSFKNGTKEFVIGKQLIKCATSVGANYRSSLRGRSRAEFIAKQGIVLEEADESIYWLEITRELKLSTKEEEVELLLKEANELAAIFFSSIKTSKLN